MMVEVLYARVQSTTLRHDVHPMYLAMQASSGAFADRVVNLHTGQWFMADGGKLAWSSALLPLT